MASERVPQSSKAERLLLRETVGRLIERSQPLLADRRGEQRTAYLRPARLSVVDATSQQPTSEAVDVFVVDLSLTGIGFVHQSKISAEDVVLSLQDGDNSAPIHIRTVIERSVSRGNGWFLSGGRFIRKTRL